MSAALQGGVWAFLVHGFGADGHKDPNQREGNESQGGAGDQVFGIHIVSFTFYILSSM
jgi:hypothetical protein